MDAVTLSLFFFFNATPPTEIYTLSLHDALPISDDHRRRGNQGDADVPAEQAGQGGAARVQERDRRREAADGRAQDRKSTRLNSSHSQISYAVFCLKKKKKEYQHRTRTNKV